MSHDQLLHARIYSLVFAAAIYCGGWMLLLHGADLSARLARFPHWPVLFDFLLTVPALTWWFYRHDRHRAWRNALGMAGLGLLLGVHWMPDLASRGMRDLHGLRIAAWVAGAAIELLLTVRLVRFVMAARQEQNPEYVLQRLLQERLGTSLPSRVIGFELRVWLHALSPRRQPWYYRGEQHFSYHLKDAHAANLQGLLALLIIGMPAQHLLLALINPWLAWVADAMTLYGLLFILAHYRACLRCPVSMDGRALYLRHGVRVCEQAIALESISAFETCCDGAVQRAPGVLNMAGAGYPNVRIRLRQPRSIEGLYGMARTIDTIYLGLDQAPRFVAALGARCNASSAQSRSD